MGYGMDLPTRMGIRFGERAFDSVDRNIVGFNASTIKTRRLFKNLIEVPDSVQLIQQEIMDFNDRVVDCRIEGLMVIHDVFSSVQGTQIRVAICDERYGAQIFSVVLTSFLTMPHINDVSSMRFGRRSLKLTAGRIFDASHNDYSYFTYTRMIKELIHSVMNMHQDQMFFFYTEANAVASMYTTSAESRSVLQITSMGEKEIMQNYFSTHPRIAGVSTMSRQLQANNTFH